MKTEKIQRCIDNGSDIRDALAAQGELTDIETALAAKDELLAAYRRRSLAVSCDGVWDATEFEEAEEQVAVLEEQAANLAAEDLREKS